MTIRNSKPSVSNRLTGLLALLVFVGYLFSFLILPLVLTLEFPCADPQYLDQPVGDSAGGLLSSRLTCAILPPCPTRQTPPSPPSRMPRKRYPCLCSSRTAMSAAVSKGGHCGTERTSDDNQDTTCPSGIREPVKLRAPRFCQGPQSLRRDDRIGAPQLRQDHQRHWLGPRGLQHYVSLLWSLVDGCPPIIRQAWASSWPPTSSGSWLGRRNPRETSRCAEMAAKAGQPRYRNRRDSA